MQTTPGSRGMKRPTGITVLAVLVALVGLVQVGYGGGPTNRVIGLVELGVAYGFWKGAGWGWWLGVIGAVLYISLATTGNYLPLIVGIIWLAYIARPSVRAWFRRA
jgi:hypothetical protein